MGIKKSKPTTAGRRDSAVDDFADITTHEPFNPLLAPLTKKGGRNKTLTPSWKKAVVTLKLGDSISLYQGE